ncbi:hypothetical protein Bpfe_021827, partial [Biomphalaria pfeifferi]
KVPMPGRFLPQKRPFVAGDIMRPDWCSLLERDQGEGREGELDGELLPVMT